jgi:hypothetical protein
MSAGQKATVTIIVNPLLGRNIRADVTATPDAGDPNTGNNNANDTGRIRFKPQRF